MNPALQLTNESVGTHVAKLSDLPDSPRDPADQTGALRRKVEEEREDKVNEWLEAIEAMRGEGCWDWADETLSGIYDSVHKNRFVSEGQKRAIRNIRDRHVGRAEEIGIEDL